MVSCMKRPSHRLDQYLFYITDVRWHLFEGIWRELSITKLYLKDYIQKICILLVVEWRWANNLASVDLSSVMSSGIQRE